MIGLDQQIAVYSYSLRSVLQRFEASCIEPGFALHISPLADQVSSYGRNADHLDVWVGKVGMGFAEADRSGGLSFGMDDLTRLFLLQFLSQNTTGLTATKFQMAQWGQSLQDIMNLDAQDRQTLLSFLKQSVINSDPKGFRDFLDVAHGGRDTIKDLLLIAEKFHTKLGDYYPGQVRISTGGELRDALNWSKHLSHMKMDVGGVWNLALDSGKKDFTEQFVPSSALGKMLIFAEIGFIGYHNWQEYKDEDTSKIVTGTVVDSAIKLGCAAAGAGIGSVSGGFLLGGALGFVSGGLLAPVGVAIGSRVGGFLGGMVGDAVADKILETDFDEKATDFIDDSLDNAVEGVHQAVENIDNAFASAIGDITRLF